MGSNTVPSFTAISDSNNNNNNNNNEASFKRTRGQVVFRLLCHASRIGAFIGKGGLVIKSLQQLTDSKIRIDDTPLDCPERVIAVIVKLDGEVDGDLTKPQLALLKVFERILDVAAESEGSSDFGDRVVSCRLLVNAGQAGSVIGKGGKVVEKIRIDTGCRIRVLNEKLPACTKPSDEIIEIQGIASSVKKALVAVAGRLQDCLPHDKTNMMEHRPNEVFQSETSAIHHEAALHTSSIRSNGNASALDPETLQQEVTFRVLVSGERIGAVIGRGGCIVKALQNETGATICIGPPVVECEDRLITITSLENYESRSSPAQKAVVLVFCRSVEGFAGKVQDLRSYKESPVTARLVVPSNQVGVLLGKGGAIVSEMRKATWTRIQITGNGQVPKCASHNDQVVQISGDFPNVQDALYNATSRLRDHLFGITQNSGGSGTVPNGRLRDHVTLDHGLNIHSLSQSIDHLTLSQNSDRSSSPGVWAPKAVGGINSKSLNDVSRRLTPHKGGLELGSGSKSVIVTNTTVEIMVPNGVIGSVYGQNGSNLDQLRQISGAKVTIREPRPGTSNKTTIILSGTPDETQAAQSLLQAYILNGSS